MTDIYSPDPQDQTPRKPRDIMRDSEGGAVVSGPSDGRGGMRILPGPRLAPIPETIRQRTTVAPSSVPVSSIREGGVEIQRIRYDPKRAGADPQRVSYGRNVVPKPWYAIKADILGGDLDEPGYQRFHVVACAIHAHAVARSFMPPDVASVLARLASRGSASARALLSYAQREAMRYGGGR